MKTTAKALIIFSAGLISTNPVFSKEIEGAFRCKIENGYLLVMQDGISKQYGGYENSLKKGDSIIFNYSYNQFGTSVSKDFTMYTPSGFRPIFNSSANINKRKAGDKELFPNSFFGTSKYGGKGNEILAISEDSIFAEGIPGGELELTRYFKNDWHGFLTAESVQDTIHVMTLNCRHVLDGLERIVKDLKQAGF